MTTWNNIKFKDFVKLQRGFDLPKDSRSDGKYPVIASTAINGYHTEYKVIAPCVTTGRSGALGEVLYIKENCWPLNTTLWVKDFCGNDPKFVYYKLKTLDLAKYNSGAGVPTLNRNHLDEVVIKIPAIKECQTKITSIISTYDNIIENNEKRIKILEELAQRLYTEWFVKFKFPGHEKVKIVDSGTEYGMIPEGWNVKKVKDSFDYIGGGTPSRKSINYWQNGSIDWYTPTDLNDNKMFSSSSSKKITVEGLKDSSAKLFPEFSVMMTSRATIGRLSINTKPSTTNQGFIVCIPNQKVSLYFLYFWLKSKIPLFIELGTGATFKEITKGNFGEIYILLPSEELTSRFQQIASENGKEILNLQLRVKNLIKVRDLLIPQLVTGKKELKN